MISVQAARHTAMSTSLIILKKQVKKNASVLLKTLFSSGKNASLLKCTVTKVCSQAFESYSFAVVS